VWLKRAAEEGSALAMAILGNRLLAGDDFKQDLKSGRVWLKRAAEEGNAFAMMELGDRLLDGNGFKQDLKSGRVWLKRAAEEGDVAGMRILGYRLLKGDGFKQDLEAGQFWHLKSVDAGASQAFSEGLDARKEVERLQKEEVERLQGMLKATEKKSAKYQFQRDAAIVLVAMQVQHPRGISLH